MPTKRGIEELLLHTDEGSIYFGYGDQRVTKWNGDLATAFVQEPWINSVANVRLLGTTENAPLLTALHFRRLTNNRPREVFLASPSRFAQLKSSSVTDVFRQIQEIDLPPSLGGWHRMTPHDYVSYALVQTMQVAAKLSDVAESHLKCHPAWPALEFIPTIDELAAAKFLAKVIDPRWHVSVKEPDKLNKLEAYFGLDARGGRRHVKAYLDRKDMHSASYDRSKLVLDAWSRGWEAMIAKDAVGPKNFLMRLVKYHARKSPIDALLLASQVFLRFVTAVWLDNLTERRVYYRPPVTESGSSATHRVIMQPCKNYSPTLFVPSYFFANKDEVEAWNKHTRASV